MAFFQYIEWLCLGVFLINALLALPALMHFFKGAGKKTVFPESKDKARFAVIIPARDESKVIEANIKSILLSNYPTDKREVYVIVESETDKTVQIAEKYEHVHVFVRKNPTGVGKGYAMDECLQDVFARGEAFDAFVILDADNVIERDFLSRMNDAYQAGFDLACGKRDNKDWNVSAVSAASGLTFTAVNTLINKPKTYLGHTILISGTGFFVRAERLQKIQGWKFHSLTEDYEITTYADCEHWKTAYVEQALYYDEQPIKMGQSIKQRSRWIKGFFSVRGKYAAYKREKRKERKERQKLPKGGIPVLCMCFALITYLVCLFMGFIVSVIVQNGDMAAFGRRLLIVLGTVYFLIALLTAYLLYAERKHMQIKPSMRVKVILFHPIFLFTYIFAAVRALFMPNTWERIDHVIYKEI